MFQAKLHSVLVVTAQKVPSEAAADGVWSWFVKGQQGASLLIAGRFLDNPCRLVPVGIDG